MIGDILLFLIAGYVLYQTHDLLMLILIILCLGAWKKNGGFEAWRPSVIKQFFHNVMTDN